MGYDATMDMLEGMKPDDTVTYRVSAETDYAVHVEMGTKNMEAQPYMRPATNQVMRNAGKHAQNADNMDEFVENLANAIAEKARADAPVDTGWLQDSITVTKL